MKVLTVCAHDNPHAIGFIPVLGDRDGPNRIDDRVPDDVLANRRVPESMVKRARGPLQRLLVERWIGRLDARGVVRKLHGTGGPADVAEQERRVAATDALAFIAPVYFVGLPAMLKGRIERVLSLGFAFGPTPDGWRGNVDGRPPLLHHRKALVMNTTIFGERSYAGGIGDAMKRLIDDFAPHFPGVAEVQHETFYAVYGADPKAITGYLDRAYELGVHFDPQARQ
jgi:NAD(P)H dehydrogenase (quinone)